MYTMRLTRFLVTAKSPDPPTAVNLDSVKRPYDEYCGIVMVDSFPTTITREHERACGSALGLIARPFLGRNSRLLHEAALSDPGIAKHTDGYALHMRNEPDTEGNAQFFGGLWKRVCRLGNSGAVAPHYGP